MQTDTSITKKTEPTTLEQVANVVGVIAALAAVAYAFKSINRRTKTNIISDDARRVLKNKVEAKKLRKAIDTYHVTGDWKKTKINEIL